MYLQNISSRFYRKTTKDNDYCSQVHYRILKTLRNYDSGEGTVKANVFFNTLEENEIRFGAETESKARNDHCAQKDSDMIKYERALRCFWYLKDTHEWIYQYDENTLKNHVQESKVIWQKNKNEAAFIPNDQQSSHSTTFTEIIQPRRAGLYDKLSITSADIDPRSSIFNSNVSSKKEYLVALLQTKNEEEKIQLKRTTNCIKYMYKQLQIDYRQLNKFFNSLLKEHNLINSSSQHTHLAFSKFQQALTREFAISDSTQDLLLIEKLRTCLVDSDAKTSDEQISLKKLSTLVGLYQFLPQNEPQISVRAQTVEAQTQRHSNYEPTTVEKLKQEMVERKQTADFTQSRNKSITTEILNIKAPHNLSALRLKSDLSKPGQLLSQKHLTTANQYQKIQKAIQTLFEECVKQFSQISSIFRKFDRRCKAAVSYSDFAFVVEEIGLKFDREQVIQIFGYFDRDHDGYLKYSDFVTMGQEVSNGFQSFNYFTERSYSPPSGFQTERVNDQKSLFVNNDMKNYISKRKTITANASVHTPMHNNLNNSEQLSNSSQFKITDKQSNFGSPEEKLQNIPTYGGPSKVLNQAFDFFSDINGGTLTSCLQDEYGKDYLTDLKLKDTFRQDLKNRISLNNFRRDNAAQAIRQQFTSRKLQLQKEATDNILPHTPIVLHKPGFVPAFYPTRLIEKALLNEVKPESAK